jgi:hypothetical protein
MIKIPEGDPNSSIAELDRRRPDDHQIRWLCSQGTLHAAAATQRKISFASVGNAEDAEPQRAQRKSIG